MNAPARQTMRYEIKHRFSGAVLFSLECESHKVCVEAAVKSRANLAGAYLADANLACAYLAGANLARANLAGAYIAAQLGHPNGWNAWTYFDTKLNEQRVQVGCQNKTIAEGRAYWQGKADRAEVMAALDYAEAIGKLRGWGAKVEQKEAA